MNDPRAPEIDLEARVAQLRVEVARWCGTSEVETQKGGVGGSSTASRDSTRSLSVPDAAKLPEAAIRPLPSERRVDVTPPAVRETHRDACLSDFSQVHDAAFIGAAYRVVLRRDPDPVGAEYYLGLLRSGASKAEILGRLRYSAEGRAIGGPIDGLARAYSADKLARFPVV